MNKVFTVLLCALFMLPLHMAHGIPAKGTLLRHVQPDGTEIMYYLSGDEHYHTYHSADGSFLELTADGWMLPATEAEVSRHKANMAKRPHRALAMDDHGMSTFPTVGPLRGLVILAEFSDNSFYEEHTNAMFQDFMNGEDFTFSSSTGSVRDYYTRQSHGQFTPTFDVVGPVKLPHTIRYYGENSGNHGDYQAYLMISDAVKLLDRDTDIDFSEYDNDGDGEVDFVYVIYAGYGEAFGAPDYTIWPHQDLLVNHGGGVTLDGVTVNRYACSCELLNTDGHELNGIGTFCHEFGHVLGLPDLYPTAGDKISYLGAWDVMDTGCYNNNLRTPANFSAYERYCVHWLQLEDLTAHEANVTLPSLDSSNRAFRLTTDNEDEVFILENRQPEGYDVALPGHGLLVTQVDFRSYLWNMNSVNNDPSHPCWRIIPADGSIRTNLAGDAFPGPDGQSSFTPYSTPAAVQWNGSALAGGLTNIHIEEGNAVFNFLTHRLSRPALVSADGADDSFTIHWLTEPGANAYETMLMPADGNDERRIIIDESFDAMVEGAYGNAADDDIAGNLDSYTATEGWSGNDLYSAGGMLLVGGYGVSGTLTTPVIDLTGKDRELTVAYRLRAHNNRSVSITIMAVDAESGAELGKSKIKANSSDNTYAATFSDLPAKVMFILTTSQERAYVDAVKVVHGAFSEDDVWATTDVIEHHTGITDCHDTFSRLSQDKTYKVMLRAMANDKSYDSDWTEANITITPDGIISDIVASDRQHDIAVSEATAATAIVEQGCAQTYHVVVKNMATLPMTDPVLSYSVEDGKLRGEVVISATLGYHEEAAVDVTVPLDQLTLEGDVSTVFSVDFRDGTIDENTDDNQLAAVTTIVSDKYLQRMTVEEGTGTWCPNCVRGIIGMRTMNRNHPDRFVGIAIHSGNTDPVQCPTYANWLLQYVEGFPGCLINRGAKVYDPTREELEAYFQTIDEYSNVGADVKAYYEDGHITFHGDVRFLHDVDDADYRIAYVITEDHIKVHQTNGYGGCNMGFEEFDADEMYVTTYIDEVARGIYPVATGEQLVNGAIDHRQAYTHSCTAVMPTYLDPEKVAVSVLVIDADGTIVNARKVHEIYGLNASGINTVAGSATSGKAIYNLAGQRLNTPAKGLNIISGKKVVIK